MCSIIDDVQLIINLWQNITMKNAVAPKKRPYRTSEFDHHERHPGRGVHNSEIMGENTHQQKVKVNPNKKGGWQVFSIPCQTPRRPVRKPDFLPRQQPYRFAP
jgi:hypothetical protein